MIRNTCLLFLFLFFFVSVKGQQSNVLITKDAVLSFFSSAPLEDIEASSRSGASALNILTGDIIFKVKNSSFEFDKKLMQEHFNENYMETDKYPLSEFKGKLNDASKLRNDGQYTLPVSGTLQIHGVAKQYTTKGTFEVKNGVIKAAATFDVKLADHKIKIPSLVGQRIAEVVQVKVNSIYRPK
jgi:hypothetical protein